jgi:hypothetical protein
MGKVSGVFTMGRVERIGCDLTRGFELAPQVSCALLPHAEVSEIPVYDSVEVSVSV